MEVIDFREGFRALSLFYGYLVELTYQTKAK